MSIVTFVVFLVIAAACAWLAERYLPGRVPGGFPAATMIGLVGAWVGSSQIGAFGPSVEGVCVVPTMLGSAIALFVLAMVSRTLHGHKA